MTDYAPPQNIDLPVLIQAVAIEAPTPKTPRLHPGEKSYNLLGPASSSVYRILQARPRSEAVDQYLRDPSSHQKMRSADQMQACDHPPSTLSIAVDTVAIGAIPSTDVNAFFVA